MAVFGTLEDEEQAEYRATLAGLEFQKSIQAMNVERERQKKEPISIGVGINTGSIDLHRITIGRIYWQFSAFGVHSNWRYCQYFCTY
jgi:class 3 adenylate cyclase